ncbi:dihydrofolate reductase family protein [Spirosoma sp. BT702]|uniref:Dihydrofolate reductase family protein n=1 Tax=Spirosoma profusum TaxID=2771354 RepID=A0A926Y2T4_9BACT|nr:dihydrofolate reductase family protein [Spirosoma profusum]MBD2701225.1 dihydrofolate reductase family protein [Spirosoma profusum]
MRKVILQEWVTIDGYAGGPKGEIDFFSAPELSQDSDQDLFDFMDSIDTILLGANTYQMFVDYWPEAKTDTEIIADRLNETPKLIFSKTLTQAPWGKWKPATVISEDAVETIRSLKEQSGKDMVLWGSISLAQSLMKAGLIDEYHLRVCPVVLGEGKALFPNSFSLPQLKHVATKTYKAGLVLLRYVPA